MRDEHSYHPYLYFIIISAKVYSNQEEYDMMLIDEMWSNIEKYRSGQKIIFRSITSNFYQKFYLLNRTCAMSPGWDKIFNLIFTIVSREAGKVHM